MYLTKKNNIFFSKLISKLINNLIYNNLKKKIENLIYLSFFYWKKYLGTSPIYFFFESVLKLRPLVGFYIYVAKKKKKKRIKIKPYFMNFKNRWLKAIFWFSRSLKIDMGRQNLPVNIINEIFSIIFLEKGHSLKQKAKYYKTILSFKTSKNFKW